eukprot:gene5429-6773_t
MSDEDKFTCISCRIFFTTAEGQRTHYKSELHRFNLKRKVFDLPPVTESVFNAKVDAIKKEEDKTNQGPEILECRICDKTFSSEGPHKQHLQSKKHKDNVAAGVPEKIRNRKPKEVKKPEEDEDKEPETIEEAEARLADKIKNAVQLPIEMCIFCNHKSETLEANVSHMAKVHSFFIPDVEYLSDLPGFIRYLSDKVSIGNICLYCNGKGRTLKSREAVLKHMQDLSHCKLLYDTDEDMEEYVEFYDFSSSYPDDGTDPDQELVVSRPNIIVSEHEVTLPDGTTIGHRDYAIYYKQKYAPPNKRLEFIQRVVGQYKQLGWHSTPKSALEIDKRSLQRNNILALKVGMKKNTQRYYKNQLLVQ